MVTWPAIIKYSDDAELRYISDQAEWNDDPELHSVDYDAADCLIDSSGTIFQLDTKQNNSISPQPSGSAMTLHDILGLVKAHAAQQGSCCVAKLYAPTIHAAFKIVASLDEA